VNLREQKMVSLLTTLREEHGAVSLKAEFEAEGTRVDELLRLVDVARAAGLKLTLKIGGCEAIRDLLEAKQIGVEYIIAPMVETGYAAGKFRAAKDSVFGSNAEGRTGFLVNLETITSFINKDDIFAEANKGTGLDGVVFGRVDFTGSLGWGRDAINEDRTTDYIVETAKLCQQHNKQLVVGGGVASESIPALRRIADVRLDRFETRKVVFDAQTALASNLDRGLTTAVNFELLWLENKQDYYQAAASEDSKRIEMLRARFEYLVSVAGK